MNKEIQRHLKTIRNVLTDQLPKQMNAGHVDPSSWRGLHEAADWLAEHRYSLPGEQAKEFEGLLILIQTTVNAFLEFLRNAISNGLTNDERTLSEMRYRIQALWEDYDERARRVYKASEDADWPVEHVKHASDMEVPGSAIKPRRDRVIVSYAHEDVRWLERLQVHLRPLERDGRIDFWADTRIAAGADWRDEIESALENATVAVLLISAHYLASDFVARHELPRMLAAAEQHGLVVLSVIVSPSQYSSMPELSRFQAVNAPDRPLIGLRTRERESIFNKVADVIRSRIVH